MAEMRYSAEDAEKIEADGEKIEIDRFYETAKSDIDELLTKSDDEVRYTLEGQRFGTTTPDPEKSSSLMTEAVKKLASHYDKAGYNVVSYTRLEQGKVVFDIVVLKK